MSEIPLGRLLIVDDESALVTALCRILTAEGYSTTGAACGPDALAALSAAVTSGTASFDVLITDLMMPGLNGIGMLHAAQKIDSDLVSIVMTGHGTIDTAVEAMKSGALDYILKPFNLTVIKPALSRALAVRHLRLEKTALLKRVAQRTNELETANRELQCANTELDAFTHSVSHDLRQPLNGLIGFAELLLGEKPGPLNAAQKEYLGVIYNSGQKLLHLTNDLLDFSRFNHQPLNKTTVDIENMVRDIFRQLQSLEPHRHVELCVQRLPRVQADPSLLRQVWVNLLSNAFKFTRRVTAPVIEIAGQQEPHHCTYSIRDNGAGFDMAHAQRLFAIFNRLHSDQDFEGTGVGLSIVQRIIERHGGRISAQAQVGKGATFTFWLPT